MTLKLKRIRYDEEGIFSELVKESGEHFCYALEHSYNKAPKLKNGVYECKRGLHQLHSGPAFDTFEVTGVKGHTGILFHRGNYNVDSDGCILLGLQLTNSSVLESKSAFDAFMTLTKGLDSFTLIVEEGVACVN